jgi:low affinity Fe/Cu permease
MKQLEKLDLILRELYKYKNNGGYYSIKDICEEANIPIDSDLEINKLAHRLKDDGLIEPLFTFNDASATLSSYGIDYCEGDSYSYSGHSVITNNYSVSIVNSPNSNIINQSSNTQINQNISNINETIESIREHITSDTTIEKTKASEILECLNEIQEAIKNGQKPKYSIKSLLDVGSGISSIGAWLTTLAQYGGLM